MGIDSRIRRSVCQKLQHGCIEQRSCLQRREVTDVGQDQQAGARDGGGKVRGVSALDELLVVAIDDPDRRLDRKRQTVTIER